MKQKIVAIAALLVVCIMSIGCLGPCDRCDGTGEVKCDKCGGDGTYEKREPYTVTCSRCGGDGREITGGVEILGQTIGGISGTCSVCGGTGEVTKYRSVEATCPKCDGTGMMTCPKCKGKG